MMFRLHTSIFPNGERFPVILHEESFQPVILPTRYIIDERRDTRKSGTLERDLRVIRSLYTWAQKREIDLEALLRSGQTLTTGEIVSLGKYLRTRRSEAIVGSINLKGEEQFEILSPVTFSVYMSVIENFLIWAAKKFIPAVAPTSQVRDAVEQAKEIIQDAFRSIRVEGKCAPKMGLMPEEVAAIREVMTPGSEKNPYKDSIQFRNHLIFELLRATGIRRGELLKIKLNYLPQGIKRTLTIERSPDDPLDPRRKEPQVKTLGREIPLPRPLAVMLWEYVHKFRKKGNHPFLFTSNRGGRPLDAGGVNWIFSLLVRKCFPRLKGRLSPHTLRYTFNDGIVSVADSLGWSQDQVQKIQKYLCGWTEDSEMPRRYAHRIIEAKTAELMEEYQRNLWGD